MSSTFKIISETYLILLLPVGVSDAGVYICEVTISDSGNNTYIIQQHPTDWLSKYHIQCY